MKTSYKAYLFTHHTGNCRLFTRKYFSCLRHTQTHTLSIIHRPGKNEEKYRPVAPVGPFLGAPSQHGMPKTNRTKKNACRPCGSLDVAAAAVAVLQSCCCCCCCRCTYCCCILRINFAIALNSCLGVSL